jgi:hypothetical protein
VKLGEMRTKSIVTVQICHESFMRIFEISIDTWGYSEVTFLRGNLGSCCERVWGNPDLWKHPSGKHTWGSNFLLRHWRISLIKHHPATFAACPSIRPRALASPSTASGMFSSILSSFGVHPSSFFARIAFDLELAPQITAPKG